uniref:Ig-like domain-containing protein n=1 Tax=Eptatretus burgeri TaxID=7764 RepID=A0A8C4R3M7_EPTBU
MTRHDQGLIGLGCLVTASLLIGLEHTIALPVWAPSVVEAVEGATVSLPCHFQPLQPVTPLLRITWKYKHKQNDSAKLVFVYEHNGHRWDGRGILTGRAGFAGLATTGDGSLLIHELRLTDGGYFACQVYNLPENGGSVWIQLHVMRSDNATIPTLSNKSTKVSNTEFNNSHLEHDNDEKDMPLWLILCSIVPFGIGLFVVFGLCLRKIWMEYDPKRHHFHGIESEVELFGSTEAFSRTQVSN